MTRRIIALAGATAALTAALGTAPPANSSAIVDRRVEFVVRNVNASALPCAADGREYTVVGDLVGPARAIAAPQAATLYLHGSGGGDFWHLRSFPEYDYARHMAARGHVSVTLDSLGYGRSDIPPDDAFCWGSVADIVQQVVDHLRAGTYGGPAFERVALAGHSAGALLAELTAASFQGVDALAVVDFAGQGFRENLVPSFGNFARRCATAPERKWGDRGQAAYGYVFKGQTRELLMANVDPDVAAAFEEAYERDPCTSGAGAGASIAMNRLLLPNIAAPVLLVYGDRGVIHQWGALAHREYFSGTDDLSFAVVADAGHALTIQRSAPAFEATMSGWLRQRGF